MEMDCARLITAIYHDKPGVMYENPPPPSDYSEDDFESPFFIYPRPQSVKGVNFIKVDLKLFPKSLVDEGKGEKEASIETVRKDENIKGKKEESRVEVLMNQINALELRIDKSKASQESFVDNAALEKKIKQEILQNEESTVFLEKKKEKRKNRKKKKSSVSKSPVSISKSYSGSDSDSDYNENRRSKSSSHRKRSHSNSDSDYNEKHRSKSSSRHKKSHSKKSSHRRRSAEFSVKQEIFSDSGEILSDDENLSSNFAKKAEISMKEEVLSDRDDYRREKIKSSKSSKKKFNDARSHDDSRNYDDSKKYYESRSRDDSRSRDSWNYEESRNRFDECQSPDDSRNRDDSRKNYSDYSGEEDRNRRYDDSNSSSRNYRSYMQREMKQELKQEPGSASYQKTNDWFCKICKLQLNSNTTYNSHIIGKKHKKMMRQISEQEVAKSSVLEITESKKFSKALDKDQTELYDEVAKIQNTCEEADHLLILGLEFVREVRGYEDTKYFCDLCSAQCVANSIIKHLIGFKHHKNCMKEYCPRNYRLIKDLEKRDSRVEEEMDRNLRDVIRFRGKGRIRVFQEIKRRPRSPEVFNPYQPSTSRQTLLPSDIQGKKIDEQKVTDEECLSRDYSDFYCKVCDSHMNNYSMWESHARGKKHARNKKKAEEGQAATSNYIEAPPGTISHLEVLIEKHCSPNDFIVGLKFIRENQGENGDLYNCFLCGSVCPTIDIIDHLYLRKHKTKYLEKMLSDGYHNSISEINSLHIGESSRESLIDAECEKLMLEFGRGKPVICIAKKTF